MRLALFGATGRAGGAILRESRAAGPRAGSTVTTGQVAHFSLTCLDTGGFVRQAPMIATARQRPRGPAQAPGRLREPSPVAPNRPHS